MARGSQRRELEAAYKRARILARRLVKKNQQKGWLEYVSKVTQYLKTNNPSAFWKWIKQTSGRGKTRTHSVQPIRDSSGELCLNPEDILKAWAGHYGKLAADETRHSRDYEYWRSDGGEEDHFTWPLLEGINEPITWEELDDIVRWMPNNKAPGDDGIPTEMWKVLFPPIRGGEPPMNMSDTPMGKVFFQIIKSMWENTCIPNIWQQANIVSIPK